MKNDLISRQAAIDIERNATVDTNPSHFEAHQKFTQFMDDAEISSFGRWQWSNGFNTALTAVKIDLKKLPSAQPDLDSAYTEGYTAAESKYRAIFDEMQANIKEKAFGKRKGLIHTADIDAMPTIEERKTGKWVDGKCNSVNIVHTAVQDSCRKDRNHDEMGSRRKRLHMQ